jgi:hypothetical protein
VIETSPSRAIRSDITTNEYGRCSAARTRNVTAAHDHEMAAAHSIDTSRPCFVEPRRHSRYLHVTSVQSRCHHSRPEERVAPCKDSGQRQLRVDISTIACQPVEQATCPHAVWDPMSYGGTCTSVRDLASPFGLGESTRPSPPAWSDSQNLRYTNWRPSSCLVNV